MHHARIPALLLLILPATRAMALELGDAAPPLNIANWIQGTPVNLNAGVGKRIYIIEFWATTCGPCRTSIPHLTDLQAKYKEDGVVIVSISKEPAATVAGFVRQMGDKMGFTVAIDQNGNTTSAYMTAFGIAGIPHAFIVDKRGKLAWHGHPVRGLDSTLAQVVSGTYDPKAAQNAEKARLLISEYVQTLLSMNGTDSRREKDRLEKHARSVGREILTLGRKNADVLNALAWRILTMRSLPTRDYPLAMEAAKAAYDLTDGEDADVLDTYARALFDTGQMTEAIKHQRKAVELCRDSRLAPDLKERLAEYEKAEGTEK
ncbi:MAG: redoxin domain-containing protein [Phycisphaerae bacterium]|nr:redoxin domain-containing protein [Phycisphaerae bacterium]